MSGLLGFCKPMLCQDFPPSRERYTPSRNLTLLRRFALPVGMLLVMVENRFHVVPGINSAAIDSHFEKSVGLGTWAIQMLAKTKGTKRRIAKKYRIPWRGAPQMYQNRRVSRLQLLGSVICIQD